MVNSVTIIGFDLCEEGREGIAYYHETCFLQSVIREIVSFQITHETQNKMFSTVIYLHKYVTYSLLGYYCTIIDRKK